MLLKYMNIDHEDEREHRYLLIERFQSCDGPRYRVSHTFRTIEDLNAHVSTVTPSTPTESPTQ